ncbi:hypothetical protein DUI87_17587 [Hirundo rustica rustica]|uniref:AAA+ ATPase domain-containing protein n=1 Tax=Hirundo rustica rustica TaxID=333673 RepID=A0A3M0JYF2_HIRRU|nr:hypothetical protein DUI87_17587 [Hirundo rustica rustica]
MAPAGGANLPWVEKYRPQALSELVSHRDILSTVQRFISEDRLPHLLLYGPPGTGKTSTILACARQLYREREFGSMVLEVSGNGTGWEGEGMERDTGIGIHSIPFQLNASDDRGIDIVRGPILSFASTRTIFKKGFKLVILDEADAMTQDAQNALRRVIEKFTENTRFCLICNYLSKIIPALQSRCTRFPLRPPDPGADGAAAAARHPGGGSTSMAFGKVTEESVYTCTGHPLKSDIANILDWMLNQDFSTAYRKIMELKTLKGLALQDILTEIHLFVHRVDFPPSIRIQLLIKLADIEYRLAAGTSEKIQLSSLIAAFQVTRDLVVAEA